MGSWPLETQMNNIYGSGNMSQALNANFPNDWILGMIVLKTI